MSNKDAIKTYEGYFPTIGIECHVQLKTKTKLFAGVGNDARNAAPNTLISHICLGMPGALPVLNQQAVEYAIRAALAFNTVPQPYSYFERKHYFYPDLPKGYQITQLSKPIVVGGTVLIESNNEKRSVHLDRVQLEEDAGKNTHPAGKDYSLVDLNRAGTPLLEIVSQPDMHSPAEAKAYVRELYLLMRYADISDADMYHGNMRFDVNVSVSQDPKTLGIRTETKNLNSFKSVEKAVEYEIKRQVDVLKVGGTVVQETRGWDDAKQKTFSQRSKEEAHDYRYFPEPDIPPVVIDEQHVTSVTQTMPVMPWTLREKLRTIGLDNATVETLIDALPAGRVMLQVIEQTEPPRARRIAHWLASEVQAMITSSALTWDAVTLSVEGLLGLEELVSDNQISSTAAKQVLRVMVKGGGDPLTIAKEHDLLQQSDETALEALVAQVIKDNPSAVADVQKGETKAIGFLVGQAMKASAGKANPGLVQKIIKAQLKV